MNAAAAPGRSVRRARAFWLAAAAVAATPAWAQFVPDVPPFTPADPTLGRPYDRIQPGPYGDPSLSRQGPFAQPHPMFRDPARDVIAPTLAPPPRVGAGLLPVAPAPPRAQPLNLAPGPVLTRTWRGDAAASVVATSRDVARALSACWNPPRSAGPIEATLRIAFARNGAPVGVPRVTYARVREPELRAAVRASAIAAARACAPLRFTPAAASAMAGRIFAIRLIALPQGRRRDL